MSIFNLSCLTQLIFVCNSPAILVSNVIVEWAHNILKVVYTIITIPYLLQKPSRSECLITLNISMFCLQMVFYIPLCFSDCYAYFMNCISVFICFHLYFKTFQTTLNSFICVNFLLMNLFISDVLIINNILTCPTDV